MKKILAALLLSTAAFTAPALADVGISLRIGDPGFYGQLDIGGYGAPRLLHRRPVIVIDRHRDLAPIYLHVPREHARRWNRYCARYYACARPVYFVRSDWYRHVYAPRYRQTRSWQVRGYADRDQRRYARNDYRDGRDYRGGRDARSDRRERRDNGRSETRRRDRNGWR